MTDNPPTEGSALVGIKMVMGQLATSHTTNGVDEVTTEQVFEPVLIRVMCVGTTVEVVGRRVLPTFLITCILWIDQYMCNNELRGTYTITFLVEHEGSNSPPGIGAVAGLTMDPNSGAAPAILVLSPRDGASG